jgi:hypothetical protein
LQGHVAKLGGIESGVEQADGFILQVQSLYEALPVGDAKA